MFQIATLNEAVEFSSQMAKANLLPAHLKGSPADCLRVVMQASRWEMDPFAVAEKTSVISGKLMYEGQLVSAVVNSRGKLKKRLSYDFAGEGNNRVLTVSGTIASEDEARTITLTHAQACRINKNGQMQANPDQQMCYIGARLWARRHSPELMLGVYTPDEMPDNENGEVDVTPEAERVARAAAPERSKRGAAAAVAAAKEKTVEPAIDIPSTPVDAKTEIVVDKPDAKFTPKPRPANVTPAAAVSEPAKETASPVLQDGVLTVLESVMVNEFVRKEVNKVANTVAAELAGIPNKIYHMGGGSNPAWQTKLPVKITLKGKATKGPTPAVVGLIETIEIATAPGEEPEQF